MGIVLHMEDAFIKKHFTEGMVGLELESQRVDENGLLSQRKHPFPNDPVIDRDFGEAQIEIGTPPRENVNEAVKDLRQILGVIHSRLAENGELLWPFSNPPVIRDEEDIIIARYEGEKTQKTVYRQYLAEKYGKYKMTFSGIHFNYSFSKELIQRNFELDHGEDLKEYQDRFYLELAQKVLEYGWMVVALLAASPVLDISFFSQGESKKTVFTGRSSLRCSDSGYWNAFSPYVDYSSIQNYADSILEYVRRGLLAQETELYYPVRIKNPGVYSLDGLKEKGVDHIELRMLDLNPFTDCGIDIKDAVFIKLFLIWLASKETMPLDAAGQITALQNFKSAAMYDLDIAKICFTDGRTLSLRSALTACLIEMTEFFDFGQLKTKDNLRFQMEKVRDKNCRYADRVANFCGENYVEKGIERAKEIQETFYV